jgi:hypothetical protein
MKLRAIAKGYVLTLAIAVIGFASSYGRAELGMSLPEQGQTYRVSVASDGTEGNADSGILSVKSISENGRFVTFASLATNLVPGDTNGVQDVFVHDRLNMLTSRVSVAANGAQGNGASGDLTGGAPAAPYISNDGRYIAFVSEASNLVPDDTNGVPDIFLRDRLLDTTERISVSTAGVEANAQSYGPFMSTDGRYVGFISEANNLVLNDTNDAHDVFLRDIDSGETTRISLASAGEEANASSNWGSVSADGRFVAFYSYATNLVADDTNLARDVFVRDRQAEITTRVSVHSDGSQANGDSHEGHIAAEGQWISFNSVATNLVDDDTNGIQDAFIHNMDTGETKRVSVASDGSEANDMAVVGSLSGDGRLVVFVSPANNLVPGDVGQGWDVFLHDQKTNETTIVSVDSSGNRGNSFSWNGGVSTGGNYVTFVSFANNLVPGDFNGVWDTFVHEIQPDVPPTPTHTATATLIGTPTSTLTPTPTGTPIITATATPTLTPTGTPTNTATATVTSTPSSREARVFLPMVVNIKPELLTVNNFTNGEVIHYRLPLLEGTANHSRNLIITNGNSNVEVAVNDTRWRGFIPLHEGHNDILITGDQGGRMELGLFYSPSTNQQSFRMVYVLGADSPGTFDAPVGAPNEQENAQLRLELAGLILQSTVAELLVDRGLPRETFRLQEDSRGTVVVEVKRLPFTVEEIRSMEILDLWFEIYALVSEGPDAVNTKNIAIIADCHADMEAGKSYACAALGGGNLALFGSNTLYSFPESYGEIEQHFLDSTLVEEYLFPELGRAPEYWAAYTTSIGAMLHEVGHSLELSHPPIPTSGDIMQRGFDYLNRLATTYEPHHGPIDPTADVMPYWNISDANALIVHEWIE